jgi:hypothetical protein
MKTTLIVLALLILAPLAGAAGPMAVQDGDRIIGALPAADSEIGLVLDGLVGTSLTIKAVGRTAGLEPEILVFDPDGYELRLGGWYRHGTGSRKARVKQFPLPETGTYAIVVRSASAHGGEVKIKIAAEHPMKIREEGFAIGTVSVGTLRFAAFVGTEMRFKVKGRDDLIPLVETLQTPDVGEETLTGVSVVENTARYGGHMCSTHGDYRLIVAGADGSRGAWKGVVKLAHPDADPRRLTVTGEAVDTFTGDKLPPRELPSSGPGPGGIGQTSTFRVRLGLGDPPPEPKATGIEVRSRQYPLLFSMDLENISGSSATVQFTSEPWHGVAVRSVATGQTVWTSLYPPPLPSAPTVTFLPGVPRLWTLVWDVTAAPIPPAGDYEAIVGFITGDARIPQVTKLLFRLE